MSGSASANRPSRQTSHLAAKSGDVLTVRTHITELRRRSLRFGYEIVRESDGVVIAEGETGHVVTDGNSRVRSMPPGFAELLLSNPFERDDGDIELVPEMSPE